MAKNLLVWAIFKINGCIKIGVWHQSAYRLTDLSLWGRSKQPRSGYPEAGPGSGSRLRAAWPMRAAGVLGRDGALEPGEQGEKEARRSLACHSKKVEL